MTIDWTQVISDFDNKNIYVEDNVPLTLGRTAIIALTVQSSADQEMPGEDRFKLGSIASKIADRSELTANEIAIVKERIGKSYIPTVVFRAWNMLDAVKE